MFSIISNNSETGKSGRNVSSVLHRQWFCQRAQVSNHTFVYYPSRKSFQTKISKPYIFFLQIWSSASMCSGVNGLIMSANLAGMSARSSNQNANTWRTSVISIHKTRYFKNLPVQSFLLAARNVKFTALYG